MNFKFYGGSLYGAYIKLVIDLSSDVNIKSIKVDPGFGWECVSVETYWCKNKFWVAVKKIDAQCSGVWETYNFS